MVLTRFNEYLSAMYKLEYLHTSSLIRALRSLCSPAALSELNRLMDLFK